MNDHQYEHVISHELMTAINQLCPTGKEQQGFVTMLQAMQADRVPPKEQALQLVQALHEGMEFGNWPCVGTAAD